MKSDILIFIIALVILGGTFAGYLNWLHIQPRPGLAKAKAKAPIIVATLADKAGGALDD